MMSLTFGLFTQVSGLGPLGPLVFMNHMFCVFVRIASARRFLQKSKTYVFLKNKIGLSVKKYTIC